MIGIHTETIVVEQGEKWRKSFMLSKALKNLPNQVQILLKCLSS